MVKSCCAVGCTNRYTKGAGISFYRFPEHKERREKWIAAIGRKDWVPGEYTWICSQHFISGEKSNDPTSPDYVPSIFKHTSNEARTKAVNDLERYDRVVHCKKRRIENHDRAVAAEVLLNLSETGNGEIFCEPHTGVGTMTIIKMSDMEEKPCHGCAILKEKCEKLERDNALLMEECERLKGVCDNEKERCTVIEEKLAELSSNQTRLTSMDILGFEGNDGKVKYYTGLPSFTILFAVFNYVVGRNALDNCKEALPYFQQFVMALIKLRLNLGDQDLSYRFGVSQSTVSRYITKWLNGMYNRMKPLIKWPSREVLRETMPMEFRTHFKSCAVIIDCFEVFIERPSSLKARAQTWSNYKHHNTVKFLIGIAPQGVITYISKGWGGRVSDLYLTNNCGFLQQLMPGDCVLADRGFTIHEGAGLYYAEVKIPPFTRGKRQLDRVEIEKSRQLSAVRILVERIIGLVRQKYSILNSTLPINFIMNNDEDGLSMIDKVITIYLLCFV